MNNLKIIEYFNSKTYIQIKKLGFGIQNSFKEIRNLKFRIHPFPIFDFYVHEFKLYNFKTHR